MAVDATPDTFAGLTGEGLVLVDFWGANCAPCLAHMPGVQELTERHRGSLQLVKVNSGDKGNRPIAWSLRVMGLPTYITMRNGQEVERLTGGEVTIDQIEAAVGRLLDGAGTGD